MTDRDTTSLRDVLASSFLDHPSATTPWLRQFGSDIPEDVADVEAIVDRILTDERLTVTPSTLLHDVAREALAKAWDEGVRTAGAYGHEDTWTHDMTPYTQNPYRGEAGS